MKAIVLHDADFAIAKDGKQIMYDKEDLTIFRELTTRVGELNVCICGYTTYEQINEKTKSKLLKNRVIFCLTHKKMEDKDGVLFMTYDKFKEVYNMLTSYNSAFFGDKKISDTSEWFVIGGGQIYELLYGFIDQIHVSFVDRSCGGDVFIKDYTKDFSCLYFNFFKKFTFKTFIRNEEINPLH